MARFFGTVQGGRGRATRIGHANKGLHVEAGSYSGGVDVRLFDKEGEDWCDVQLIPWKGAGSYYSLYRGPVHGPKSSDVDAALRCRTCVSYNKWENKFGPEAHGEHSAPK